MKTTCLCPATASNISGAAEGSVKWDELVYSLGRILYMQQNYMSVKDERKVHWFIILDTMKNPVISLTVNNNGLHMLQQFCHLQSFSSKKLHLHCICMSLHGEREVD